MSRPRKRLLTFNDPQPLRIDRRLAMEIGFLESVVLLQIEFLISISHNERDGQFWTYHTLRELKDRHFPWLSQATICRTIQSLESKGLIIRGHHNRSGFDRTQWFALNYDGIAKLQSIRIGEDAPIFQSAKRTLQDATSVLQSATSMLRDEPTIPETPPETHPENTNNTAAATHTVSKHKDEDVVVALLHSLIGTGVTKKRAEELVKRYSPERIRAQLAYLPCRKAEDPAAVLVRAIEEDWAVPPDYKKREAQRKRDEQKRIRHEYKVKQDAERAAAEEALRVEQDEWWNSLTPDERDALTALAEETLRQRSPFLFSNGGPKKTGVMYRTMFDAERRRLIEERRCLAV
jgi:DNA-binding PadR family transcriptional regulator